MTDTEIRALLDSAERTLFQRFLALEETERTNFARVMEAFRAEHVAVRHFAPTTGYGYGDDGRDALERIAGEAGARVDARGLAEDLGAGDLLVTPAGIDEQVRAASALLADAIDLALHAPLTLADIRAIRGE